MQDSMDSTSSNAISLSGIDLTLQLESGADIHILKGINLELERGKRCGLIGPSGSGKTSLLTIISGLRRPTKGMAKVLGSDLGSLDEENMATFRRDKIGIVFQNFHLLPTMTALENAALPLELANDPAAEDKAAAVLKSVGLNHRTGHFPHQLSGGEQQRTAIARAFVARPQLVLADEPTGNLDEHTSSMVMDTLYSMSRESNTTILLITHNTGLLSETDIVKRMSAGNLEDA